MINKKLFERLRKEMQKHETERESVILKTREVVSLSKKVIYSVQRGKADEKAVRTMVGKVKDLVKKAQKNPSLKHVGSYKVAMQEYVEAMTFLSYRKSGSIPNNVQLGVEAEHYLLGLCDLSGELTRLAINSGIKGDYNKIKEIKEFISELYAEMSQFDFKNSELRRKYDQIKWSLEKLEDAVFELAIKGKLRK